MEMTIPLNFKSARQRRRMMSKMTTSGIKQSAPFRAMALIVLVLIAAFVISTFVSLIIPKNAEAAESSTIGPRLLQIEAQLIEENNRKIDRKIERGDGDVVTQSSLDGGISPEETCVGYESSGCTHLDSSNDDYFYDDSGNWQSRYGYFTASRCCTNYWDGSYRYNACSVWVSERWSDSETGVGDDRTFENARLHFSSILKSHTVTIRGGLVYAFDITGGVENKYSSPEFISENFCPSEEGEGQLRFSSKTRSNGRTDRAVTSYVHELDFTKPARVRVTRSSSFRTFTCFKDDPCPEADIGGGKG